MSISVSGAASGPPGMVNGPPTLTDGPTMQDVLNQPMVLKACYYDSIKGKTPIGETEQIGIFESAYWWGCGPWFGQWWYLRLEMPAKGYTYDGMYKVEWMLNSTTDAMILAKKTGPIFPDYFYKGCPPVGVLVKGEHFKRKYAEYTPI